MRKKKSLNEMFETICGVKINEDFDGGGASIFIPDAEGNYVAGSARNYDDHNMQDNAENGEESNINDFGESQEFGKVNGLPPKATTYVKRQVKNLKKGDQLGSGIIVLSDPVAGLRTPAGQVEIAVRYSSGVEKVQLWNKNTVVSVKQTPMDEIAARKSFPDIIEYFKKYYQIDVTGLDQKIVEKIYNQWDEITSDYDGLSDMEENPDGSLGVEFDGMYGKHWKSFKSHDEFEEYYNRNFKEPLKKDFNNLYKQYSTEIERRKIDTAASANTLGNMHPDAFNKLKTNMSTLNERVLKIFLAKQ